MPRYEYSEGTSNKFWEIELAGSKYTAKWGKIGGSISMSTKECGDPASAKKQYDKLIAEKVKKGYRVVGGKPTGKAKAEATAKPARKPAQAASPSGPARNLELEKAILANPDDPEPYLVYADWLQGQSEIRGDLIVLQHAGKTKEANALIRKFSEWFLGSFGKQKPPVWQLEWQYGYIKHAEIGWSSFTYDSDEEGDEEDEEVWSERCRDRLVELLEHPSGRFIQSLSLGPIPGDENMDLAPFAAAIDKVKPACLRELYLGSTGEWDISSTSTEAPDSKSIKGLRKLVLRGGSVTIGKLDLPELREFRVESGGLTTSELKAIGNAKWPKLEKLEIWCGDPNYGATGSVKDLAAVLAGVGLKHLKHLGIMNCAFADEVAKALIKSKILPQLETLDLSMGNLSDRGVDTMVAAKDAFAHLKLLELDDNALTEVSKPKLKGLAHKANFGTQDSPDRAVPRGEDRRWYRYVAVGE